MKDVEYYSVLLNFFLSKQDECLNHSNIPLLFPNANTIEYFDDNHRFDKFEIVIPKIEMLYRRYISLKFKCFDLI